MPPTFALIVVGLIALPALAIGAVVGSIVTFAYVYRRQLLELIRRANSKSDGQSMKLDIRRMFWWAILGSLIVIVGCIGCIHAIYADDFWAQQGWMVFAMLGFWMVVWGFWRGLKSN